MRLSKMAKECTPRGRPFDPDQTTLPKSNTRPWSVFKPLFGVERTFIRQAENLPATRIPHGAHLPSQLDLVPFLSAQKASLALKRPSRQVPSHRAVMGAGGALLGSNYLSSPAKAAPAQLKLPDKAPDTPPPD
jgi:hypothetical protein